MNIHEKRFQVLDGVQQKFTSMIFRHSLAYYFGNRELFRKAIFACSGTICASGKISRLKYICDSMINIKDGRYKNRFSSGYPGFLLSYVDRLQDICQHVKSLYNLNLVDGIPSYPITIYLYGSFFIFDDITKVPNFSFLSNDEEFFMDCLHYCKVYICPGEYDEI